MEYKSILEPHEWYGWKRKHPDEYMIIKAYLLKRFPFCTEEYDGTTYTNLLIPRRFFTLEKCLVFSQPTTTWASTSILAINSVPITKAGHTRPFT